MVDFGKRLGAKPISKPLEPSKIYQELDRASDKGPLRPAQISVLNDWHSNHRGDKDSIVKLHTGQGKTLIGLLMLQSKLNEGKGPAVYLCPNNYLIEQTVSQAKQFGISVVKADPELPADFLDGNKILVTSVQKMFNGLTKFKLGSEALQVGTVLMDDAHACVDSIRSAFTIKISNKFESYTEIRNLFSDALKNQGVGSYVEIESGSYESILPVPYWEWRDKEEEVTRILAKEKEQPAIKFPWILLRDIMGRCQCVVSGAGLEISPYLAPLDLFGSYYDAAHRIFMSATVTDDSFLVKGLGIDAKTIRAPLKYEGEKWSGEKMILIPELIHDSLDKAHIVSYFADMKPESYGVVAITPSEKTSEPWKEGGATVANTETINQAIDSLKNGNFGKVLTIYNRYDGIDLPDNTCRILILDGRPYSDTLIDRYSSKCRPGSEVNAIRIARSIEQGLGRSVRGEKDYSVIILSGSDLVESVRSHSRQVKPQHPD